jgi:hypothetical protein
MTNEEVRLEILRVIYASNPITTTDLLVKRADTLSKFVISGEVSK